MSTPKRAACLCECGYRADFVDDSDTHCDHGVLDCGNS